MPHDEFLFAEEDSREWALRLLRDLVGSTRRVPVFLTKFENGFAKGWAWPIPRGFATALDISPAVKKVTRVNAEGKQIVSSTSWMSQGQLFAFRQGDTIYDTPRAYSRTWAESLSYINRSVFVLEAESVSVLLPESADPSIKRKRVILPGKVKFELKKKTAGKLVTERVHTLSQADFVRFLISGEL